MPECDCMELLVSGVSRAEVRISSRKIESRSGVEPQPLRSPRASKRMSGSNWGPRKRRPTTATTRAKRSTLAKRRPSPKRATTLPPKARKPKSWTLRPITRLKRRSKMKSSRRQKRKLPRSRINPRSSRSRPRNRPRRPLRLLRRG